MNSIRNPVIDNCSNIPRASFTFILKLLVDFPSNKSCRLFGFGCTLFFLPIKVIGCSILGANLDGMPAFVIKSWSYCDISHRMLFMIASKHYRYSLAKHFYEFVPWVFKKFNFRVFCGTDISMSIFSISSSSSCGEAFKWNWKFLLFLM